MKPNKRTFDLVVITALLLHAAWSIPNNWAHRVRADQNESGFKNNLAGAVELMG